MIKAKLLVGFACLIATLAATATPALATFESGALKGTSTVTAAGEFNAEGAKVKCAAAGITAPWVLPALKSATAALEVKWQTAEEDGKCTTEVAGLKLKATVKACNLTLEQVGTKTTEVTGGVETECIVKAVTCTIKVPPAAVGKNKGLKTILVKNTGPSKDISLTETNAQGITATLTGSTCPVVGTVSKASLTGFQGIALGVKII